MKSALFINLKRFGDIFCTGKLISSFKAEHPEYRVGLVVFKEFRRAADLLSDVDDLYCIDRKHIVSIKKNNIFSSHHSVEILEQYFSRIEEGDWNKVVNCSHDLLATFLTSYLTYEKSMHTGLKISNEYQVSKSGLWAEIQNDVSSVKNITPINHSTTLHRELGLVDILGITNNLKVSHDHEMVAESNIQFLRKNESIGDKATKVIGIQVRASNISKEIPYRVLVELIDIMLDSPSYFPVILIAPDKEERNLVKKLNKEFDNKLISIESDFYAAASVLKNLDGIITPCTSIKHLADLVNLPTLEISLGSAPLFKQHTTGLGNIILSPSPEKRLFNEKCLGNSLISANDIFIGLNLLYGPSILPRVRFSSGLSVYKVVCDSLGSFPRFIAGDISFKIELTRYFGRCYLKSLETDLFEIDPLWENCSHYPKNMLLKWIENEYLYATSLTRDLLNGLRSVVSIKNGHQGSDTFVHSLEKILSYAHENTSVSIPVLIFKGKLESLAPKGLNENIQDVEKLFFSLKSNIQNLLSSYKMLTHKIENEHNKKTKDQSQENRI